MLGLLEELSAVLVHLGECWLLVDRLRVRCRTAALHMNMIIDLLLVNVANEFVFPFLQLLHGFVAYALGNVPDDGRVDV